MTGTRGLNREESWFSTSAKSCWCFKSFLIFMILTIAACTQQNREYLISTSKDCYSLFVIPVWGASCLPQCSCVSSPALVSARSSLAHWYSPVTSYCTQRQRTRYIDHKNANLTYSKILPCTVLKCYLCWKSIVSVYCADQTWTCIYFL